MRALAGVDLRSRASEIVAPERYAARVISRSDIEAAVQAYFDALDRGDPIGAAELFANGAVLICESTDERYEGQDAIRGFFELIGSESAGMLHTSTNVVVDVDKRSAAAELRYTDDLHDGRRYDMQNCDFFDLDQDGRFTRVRFWLGEAL